MTPCHQLTIYNINYSIPSLHMPLSMPLSPLALSATLLYILPKFLSKCQMSQCRTRKQKPHHSHPRIPSTGSQYSPTSATCMHSTSERSSLSLPLPSASYFTRLPSMNLARACVKALSLARWEIAHSVLLFSSPRIPKSSLKRSPFYSAYD